jgi:sodium transport system permease protein
MISFVEGYNDKINSSATGKVNMWYKSTNLTVKDRITSIIDDYEEEILDTRISALSLTKAAINPIELYQYDIAPKKEQLGKLAGGILPYLFIIFCFSGCMYPGLDLITGEKERGTIETLLTVPSSRFKILLGKVITIAIVGLAAAVMTILGLVAALKFLPDIPQDLLDTISNIIQFKYVMMLFIMIIPLSFFFAGMISAMVVRAKSFKEAQSILTPISFVIIMPALIGMMPGIELNWGTAAIPILNIALATKEIVAGTIQMGHYVFIVATLVLLAIAAVFVSYKQFSKEGMILK